MFYDKEKDEIRPEGRYQRGSWGLQTADLVANSATKEKGTSLSKRLRSVLRSIFCGVFALYLGYAFADIFLKPFIPHDLANASVLLCGVGFFFVLRWLMTKEAAPARKAKAASIPVIRNAMVPQRFIRWESLYSPSPVLEARAFSELTELMAQSRFQGNRQREHIENIVALATTKLEGCTGHKRCHLPKSPQG